MEARLQLGKSRGAVLDGALALALSAGVSLELEGPLDPADAALIAAAARLGADPAAADAARDAASRSGTSHVRLQRPRPGAHVLELFEPGTVSRAVVAFSWPLALLGRPSTLVLRGPNHTPGSPTFHELRLAWAPLAAAFGLRVQLELRIAAFADDGDEAGEVGLHLDPAPALTPLQLSHRGLLRQVTVVGASGGNAHAEVARATQAAVRALRSYGIEAEAERVPLPHLGTESASKGRWAISALAECEHSLASASEVPALPAASAAAEKAGERVAASLGGFLASRGALDGRWAERMLVPAILCAAGLGARAGPSPSCHFTTTAATEPLIALAQLAHTVLPVRAIIDGLPGEEAVVAVAPAALP